MAGACAARPGRLGRCRSHALLLVPCADCRTGAFVTSDADRTPGAGVSEPAIPFGTAVRAWFAISLQTFGSPAGQIAVMQRTLVEEKRWIGQRRFLHAMNYCMLLPGPEAQQLA